MIDPDWLTDYVNRVRRRTAVPIRIAVTYSGDTVVLNAIRVPDEYQGMGHGEWALSELVRLADVHGVRLALTPTGEWGASKRRLTKWYKRHGFRENRGRRMVGEVSETMIRD